MAMSKVLILIGGLLFQACTQTSNLEQSEPKKGTKPCVIWSDTETIEGRIFIGNEPLDGVVCTYFPSGKTHTETSFINGIKEGAWSVFYPNGNLEKSGSLVNGKDDGDYLEYYENGQLKYEYHYARGIKTGIWKSWYTDGGKYTERHFTNNLLHGKVLVWDELGRLAKEYDYINGNLVKKQMHFESFEK